MKKIVLFVMVLALTLSWSLAVSANFVPSIEAKPAPEVSGATDEAGEAIQMVIVSLANKDELPEEAKQALETAYNQIVNAKDISEVSATIKEQIEELAENAGVKAEDLVASDLFDLSPENLGEATENGEYNVSLAVPSLKNFVCLLHYVDGEWEVVSNAKVSADGKNLEFSVDGFSPFAIITASPDAVVDPARKPVPLVVWILIGILVGALIDVAIIFFMEKKAKQTAAAVNANQALKDSAEENVASKDKRSKK